MNDIELSYIKNRLKVSKQYHLDQFLLACCNKDNKIKYLIILIMVYKINPKYCMLMIYNIYEVYQDIILEFIDYLKNDPINKFKLLYNLNIQYNISYLINYLKFYNVSNDIIKNITTICNSHLISYNTIINTTIRQKLNKQLVYKKPIKVFESDYCPICMNQRMRYVWLTCGHNLCKDCYEKLVSINYSPHFKCPYCNSIVKIYQ